MTHEKALELIALQGWRLLCLTNIDNKPKYGVYDSDFILIGEGATPLKAVIDAEIFIHGKLYD